MGRNECIKREWVTISGEEVEETETDWVPVSVDRSTYKLSLLPPEPFVYINTTSIPVYPWQFLRHLLSLPLRLVYLPFN